MWIMAVEVEVSPIVKIFKVAYRGVMTFWLEFEP